MAAAVDPESWQLARLLPTVGLRGQEEQEQRATSSLLAVLYAVPEFGRALLEDLGAPRGRVTTYTELQLTDAAGKRCIPDGAIVVERGNTRWQCLVEVKTGAACLKVEQVSRYLDWARDNGFDAVLTISNEITASPSDLPLTVDGRKLKRVRLITCPGGESSPRRSSRASIAAYRIPTRRGCWESSSPTSIMSDPAPAGFRAWARAGWRSVPPPPTRPCAPATRVPETSPSAGTSSSTTYA
jgi:hypothetical protein